MKKKKILKEKMGGGYQVGLGGFNSDGPHYNRHNYKHPSGYHSGGYQGNADSQISQRHALASTLDEEEEIEYKEDQKMLEEEETLYEFFARIAKLPLNESNIEEGHCNIKEGHCSTHESHCTMSEMHCDEALRIMEEQELEEISTVASLGGGPTTPLGTDSTGRVSNNKKRLTHAKSTYGGN